MQVCSNYCATVVPGSNTIQILRHTHILSSLSIVSFPFVHSSTCQSNFVNFNIFYWKPDMWSRDNYMRNYIQTIITVVPSLHTMRKLVLKFTHTQTRFQLQMDKNILDLMEWISAEIFVAWHIDERESIHFCAIGLMLGH